MDWPAFFTAATPVLLAIIAIVGAYMNTRLAEAKAAALAAVEAAKTAVKVAEVSAKETGEKLDGVERQLDGRITEFFAKIEKDRAELAAAFERRSLALFERGRQVGHDEATTGPIAAKLTEVQEHLTKQDEDTATRHEENRTASEPRKPADLATATEVTVDAAQHADDLAKKLKKKG